MRLDHEELEQTEKQLAQLAELRDKYPQLFTNGEHYSRSVVTHYNDAVFCAKKGDAIAAGIFMGYALETIDHLEEMGKL